MDDSGDGATRRPRSARQYGTRYGLTYGRRTGRHTGTHTRPYRRPYRPGIRSTAQNGPNQATAGRSGIISPPKRLEALRGAILELEHAEALRIVADSVALSARDPAQLHSRPCENAPSGTQKRGPERSNRGPTALRVAIFWRPPPSRAAVWHVPTSNQNLPGH